MDLRQTRNFYCHKCWEAYEADRLQEHWDTPAELEAKVAKLTQLIAAAKYVVAFTGMGLC